MSRSIQFGNVFVILKNKLMSVFPVFVDECISVCYHPVDPQQL